MCGIAGAVWSDPARAISDRQLAEMVARLRHRGPDEEGVYYRDAMHIARPSDVGVALGHRRLSIIGVSDGQQPMTNEDETLWIVFNGEIYNHGPLREELLAKGHRFATHSDTEVLLHLYEEHEQAMVARLNGMFAFALWDSRCRQLLLARDRFGKKPLYYRHEPGRLLFASELKSLVAIEDVPRRIDPLAVDAYLTYQYVPHPRTIYEGISKLPPAHWAIWRNDALRTGCYWDPDFNLETRGPWDESGPGGATASAAPSQTHGSLSEHDAWRERLSTLLTDSVRLRLQSEVPLGAFLSGGVDSSIIVGLMTELAGRKVKTFSIGFPVKEYDERHYARQVARHLGTEHEEFVVEPDALAILPKLIWHYDEPMADSSAIPTWYVSELTRRHVTVSLTGDGGDELFVGYPRYRAVWLGRWVDRLPMAVRRVLGHRLWQRLPGARYKSPLRRLKRFLSAVGQGPLECYLEWIAIFGRDRRAALHTDGFAEQLGETDPIAFLRAARSRSERRDRVTSIALTDLMTYLPCDLMTKVDIASMAHGLECRQPFLDYRVVELAARMPLAYKFRGGHGKRILIETFERFLPESVRTRPKMGFGVPLDHWFRGPLAPLARDVLTDQRARERGMFRPAVVENLLEEHITGRADHAYRLWALLVLELWQREWIDGR